MTFLRAALIVVVTSAVGAAVGGCVGMLIGWVAPGYYRAVIPKAADLDQVSVGFSLGMPQGLGAGLVGGILLVAILTWQHVRLANRR